MSERKKIAVIKELTKLPRKPMWREGSANVVTRDGRTYMALCLDGMALEVPADEKAVQWLHARIQDFAKLLANEVTPNKIVEREYEKEYDVHHT